MTDKHCSLNVGWGLADITPGQPVYLAGHFNARLSQGIMDPLTATALALESTAPESSGALVMVSCDLINISDALRDAVRGQVSSELPELDPRNIVLNATHTHTAPVANTYERYKPDPKPVDNLYGVDLGGMTPSAYVAFASARIAEAVRNAWSQRAPGGIAYGMGFAVVGRNRLTSYLDGTSSMYGSVNHPGFSHMEGSMDPAVYILATYDAGQRLTGLVVNTACPAQVSENAIQVTADFWHETRNELRSRFGRNLPVLAQCAPAGDQSPHLHGSECRQPQKVAARENPEVRMWRLAGRTQREEIGVRIADAVATALPLIEKEIDWSPVFKHHVEIVVHAKGSSLNIQYLLDFFLILCFTSEHGKTFKSST